MPQAGAIHTINGVPWLRSQEILEHNIVEHRIRQQALQLCVLVLKLLQAIGVRQVHPAILGLGLVKRRRAQTVLPAKLGGRQASLLFLDHPDELRLGETAFPHVVCSFSGWANATSLRGNFRGAGHGHSSPGEKRRWAALTCRLLLKQFVEEPASAYTINFDIQVCRTSLSDQGFIRCLMVLLSYEANV